MTSPADVHAAKLATIEAADDAEESLRERVARAINDVGYKCECRYCMGGSRRMADAAIATICTPVEGAPAGCGAEAALRRVTELCEAAEDESNEWYYANRYTHENGINYVAGFSEGWDHFADRIRDAAGDDR